MGEIVPVKKHSLPEVVDNTLSSVTDILRSFNLPREIIASNEEVEYAWRELPREISRIPFELRDGLIARMCVATSVGLFDGAINYIWNAVILNLRTRAKNFGLGYIAQTLNKTFEEEDLYDLRDSELLELCHKLELLSEEGFFFLNQCRDIRNNFSVAHPSMAQIDDRELISFISRCCKHGISHEYTLQGIHITEFIDTIKDKLLSDDALKSWVEKLENTFSAQRLLLIPMLHGLYCDPSSKEHTRLNALSICEDALDLFDSKIQSSLIERHGKYLAKSQDEKVKASRQFFQKLDLLNLLGDAERHLIVRSASLSLLRVHQSMDNFYNEPPFAKNLLKITESTKIPITAQEEYVLAVITCYVGNPYGVSNAAIKYYVEMIENFSPKEIDYTLNIPKTESVVKDRIKSYVQCKRRYLDMLEYINIDSMSAKQKERYDKLISKKK